MRKHRESSVVKPPRLKKWWLIGIVSLALLALASCETITQPPTDHAPKTSISKSAATSQKNTTPSTAESSTVNPASQAPQVAADKILAQLITYTNERSAGPKQNYYWENGTATLSGFETLKAGEAHFEADENGRAATARAILTYDQYQASKGSRQGQPLDPPHWPKSNPKIAITFALTAKTYHGYLYNRSHSIADSLLGEASYTSKYNFTTGTRSQNVGADQHGGMRYAEELAEHYWKSHPQTSETISYQTKPIYNGNETMPRGSIVDIKSSDGLLDVEVVVINSAEGITLDYQALAPASTTASSESASATATHPTPSIVPTPEPAPVTPHHPYTSSGQWSVAAPGMVFVSTSHKYYTSVINPQNYVYQTQGEAEAAGAVRASRGNQYARP
ncbi:MAG: DNA/RNA non-specific endonuclease [Streptococcaceae bacterium]|nr:DNA/RNA non-specific endonuclease [Streptococcaceae bacterium]